MSADLNIYTANELDYLRVYIDDKNKTIFTSDTLDLTNKRSSEGSPSLVIEASSINYIGKVDVTLDRRDISLVLPIEPLVVVGKNDNTLEPVLRQTLYNLYSISLYQYELSLPTNLVYGINEIVVSSLCYCYYGKFNILLVDKNHDLSNLFTGQQLTTAIKTPQELDWDEYQKTQPSYSPYPSLDNVLYVPGYFKCIDFTTYYTNNVLPISRALPAVGTKLTDDLAKRVKFLLGLATPLGAMNDIDFNIWESNALLDSNFYNYDPTTGKNIAPYDLGDLTLIYSGPITDSYKKYTNLGCSNIMLFETTFRYENNIGIFGNLPICYNPGG